MGNLVLTPFCEYSIYAYHYFTDEEKCSVDCFFDNDKLLNNEKYKDSFIFTPHYRNHVKIVICSRVESTIKALTSQFLNFGYREEDISLLDFEAVDHNLIKTVDHIDLDRISQLAPERYNMILAKIRKKKMLASLDAPGKENSYSSFDGNSQGFFREKSFVDARGGYHLVPKQVTVYVTDKCSLKCKACAAGKQYFCKEEAKDIPIEIIKKDFIRLMELVDWIDILTILGGEPLLRTDIGDIADFICSSKASNKIGRIWIVTNGTVVPKKNILDLLSKQNNLEIMISNYKEKSVHLNALIDKLAEYKINYTILHEMNWSNTSQFIQNATELSNTELLEKRRNGCVCQCNMVSEGKFYLCDLLNTMDRLKIVPDRDRISVDIYDKNAKKEIAKYLDFSTPLPPACSWCNGISENAWNCDLIPVAEQVEQPIQTKRYS